MGTPVLKHNGNQILQNNNIIRAKELDLMLMQKLGDKDFAQLKIMLFLTSFEEGVQVSENIICQYCKISESGYKKARKKLIELKFITLLPGQEIIVNYDNIYSGIENYSYIYNLLSETNNVSGSQGEKIIKAILTNFEIKFLYQYTNDNCRFSNTNQLAIFDFYLPEYNVIIEFDGIQHFYPTSGWNTRDNVKKVQEHDKIKNQWCKDNDITLIRIPYTYLNKLCIEDLLPETSRFVYTRQEKYLQLLNQKI